MHCGLDRAAPRTTRRHAARLLLCFAALLPALPACREDEPPAPAVHKVAERGPLRFSVSSATAEVWLADPIPLELSFIAPAEYAVELPAADQLAELTVREVGEVTRRLLPDGQVEWRRTIVLESYQSGTLEIPPLVARYGRSDTSASRPAELTSELATGSVEIEVRSALTTQDSPERPRDITGTLTIPPRPMTPLEWGLIAAGVLLAGVLVWLAARWLKAVMSRPAPPESPEAWATRMLAALRWPEQESDERIRAFYYGLTEIVRGYIERKFEVAALEMTTEEFLTMLARRPGAVPLDAASLRDFLTRCDLVKYALAPATREEGQQAIAAARQFVRATAAAVRAVDQARSSQPLTGGQPA